MTIVNATAPMGNLASAPIAANRQKELSLIIRLLDPFVSRRHAELTVREDGSLAVRDLGSSLGTSLEDEEIAFSEVVPESVVRLGVETKLSWRAEDE